MRGDSCSINCASLSLQAASDEQWRHSMNYIETISELNYLTQIVIMLYEDSSEEENSERRFHVELHFSPGAYGCFDIPAEVGRDSDVEKNETKRDRLNAI